MRAIVLFLVFLFFGILDAMAGCNEPFGEYKPKEGETRFIINKDQSVDLYLGAKLFYQGTFSNFDELKGTEFHNFENTVFVRPRDLKHSYIAFHISEDCKLIKAFIHRKYLDRFGGEPPKLDAKLYFKND